MRCLISHGSPVWRALLLLAALVLATGTASADITKEQCIDANTNAQSAMRAHKLGDARALLQSCLDPHCPALVRADCARRLDVVERIQPTIIFDAKDDTGNDVSAVAVSMDGHLLSDRLDGGELSVDPGPHEFVFQVAGGETVKQSYVLKEFEKARRELVVVRSGVASPSPPPPHPSVTRPPTGDADQAERAGHADTGAAGTAGTRGALDRPVPNTAYLFGGIAAVGFLDFAIAGALGNHLKGDLQNSGCSPFCDQNKVNDLRTRYLVADLGLGVGIAGLVGTAIVFFTRPSQLTSKAEPRPRASSAWVATPLPMGGVIGWRAAF